MYSVHCNIVFKTLVGSITLTYAEMLRLTESLVYIEEGYEKLLECLPNYADEVDIPYPSHNYSPYVVSLGENCYFFTSHHNNSVEPFICIYKNGVTLCLTKDIFDFDFVECFNEINE